MVSLFFNNKTTKFVTTIIIYKPFVHKSKHILLLLTALLVSLNCYAGYHITLRVNNAYAPFEYINKEGMPVGFTLDVFFAINRINKLDYDVKSDKEIFNFYSTGIDSTELVTSMDSVPPNGKFIVSEPFGYIDHDLVTRIYSTIYTWQDMHGKTVLIVKDSPMIEHIERMKIKPNFVYIKSVPDGLRLLSSGKYDAMITSNDAAYFYMNRLELKNLSVKPLFCQPLPVRFAMLNTPQNKRVIHKINNALQNIRANGTYDYIYSRRFFPPDNENLSKFEIFLICSIVAVILILIVYVLYVHWLYQTEKRKHTEPIIDETPLVTGLSKIYNSLPFIAIYYDHQGFTQFINEFGYKMGNENRHRPFPVGEHNFFDYTILNKDMIDKLKDKKSVNFTYNLANNDNTIFNYLGDYPLQRNHIYNIHIVPLSNYGTALIGYMAYIFDITAKHNTDYTNLKYITSLSQIADNKMLDICYYDAIHNKFYQFTDGSEHDTEVSYEQSLTYIHPLYRSIFIDEFLSILNGEKRKGRLTIKRCNPKSQKYSICDVTLNAIRVDHNTTIGMSIVSTPSDAKQAIVIKNRNLENRMALLVKASHYQFIDYTPETDRFRVLTVENTYKDYTLQQAINHIHVDDRKKAVELFEQLKSFTKTDGNIIVRFFIDDLNRYGYYRINLHSCYEDNPSSENIIGVYSDITDQIAKLRELEEFKDVATLVNERNDMGFFEYCPTDHEHFFIPFLFTEKYGIDDNNFNDCMDEESRNIFFSMLDKFHERAEEIDENIIVKMTSPDTGEPVYMQFMIIPLMSDVKQEVYKYMGFIKDITNEYLADNDTES